MSVPNKRPDTYEAFEKQRSETDAILEYIDGIIFMSPSPNIKHQEISSYLQGELYILLKNKSCKVFAAPTDFVFQKDSNDEKKVVVPDLFVACDPGRFTENEFLGAPDFILEILSPSSKSHDMITKLNLYMGYGVKEYWIVDPMKKHIMIYSLDAHSEVQFNLVQSQGIAVSSIFTDFKVKAADLFS